MSRPSYLRGRQEVAIPEPPSIAARRRNSNAAVLQLQPGIVDPKARSMAAYTQTPSPKQQTKSDSYFRHAHSIIPPTSATSPYALANGTSTTQRHRLYGHQQPPTPISQHIPAWQILEEQRPRGGSISGSSTGGDSADDPLNILDTLPIQNLRISGNAPASDSRCGSLRRPGVGGTDDQHGRRTTWPAEVVLNPSASGIASRRNATGTLLGGTAVVAGGTAGGGEQIRISTVKHRTAEPESTVRR